MGFLIERDIEVMNCEVKKSAKSGAAYSLITLLDDDFKTMDIYYPDVVNLKRGDTKTFSLKVERVGFDTRLSIVSIV